MKIHADHDSGLIVCAALGTIIFHLRGGIFSFFRGGLRLVLAGFLLFAALWALIGFVATFIDTSSPSGCQIAVVFSSAFDELARITLQEFLFWAIKCDLKASFGVLFPQAIIFVRAIVGAILVAVQRPQFAPVCVTATLFWPIGVVVLVMDAFIVVMLLTRASYVGIYRDMKSSGSDGVRAKALILTTVASGIWIPVSCHDCPMKRYSEIGLTGMLQVSVPMILGIDNLGIATRTALPAVGVLLVIGIIAPFPYLVAWYCFTDRRTFSEHRLLLQGSSPAAPRHCSKI